MAATGNFTYEFKRDAVTQITARGYPVGVVSEPLGEQALALSLEAQFAKAVTGHSL